MVYSVRIMVDEIEFAESAKRSGVQSQDDGFMNIPDGMEEELPFN